MKRLFALGGKERFAATSEIIEDRREEGVSFSDAVLDYAASRDLEPSRIRLGSCDRLFEEVEPLAHSEDGQYVLAIGRDEGREILLRAGEPVLADEYPQVRVVAKTPDLSRLIVGTQDEQDEQSFYFVYGLGQSRELMRGRDLHLLWCAEHLERFWLSRTDRGQTVFVRSDMGGVPELFFSVERKFDFVSLARTSEDRNSIIWRGTSGLVDYLFKNDQLLAKGNTVRFWISPDLSRMLTVINWDRRGNTKKERIVLNGMTIRESLVTGRSRVVADDEVIIAAVDLEDKRTHAHRLFGLKGEKQGLSRPYERLISLEQSLDGEQIVARVLRDDKRRTLVIKKEKVGQESSQVIEESVTPVTS